MPLADQLRGAIEQGIEQGRKEGEAKATSPAQKELLNKMINALKPTLAGEDFDLGLALQGPVDGKYVLVGGMKVKDGKQIETALRDAVAAAKPDDKAEIKLDAAKAADGTPIHRITGKEKADEKMVKAFGETVVYFAVNNDTAIAAFGASGLDAVQKALVSTAKPLNTVAGADQVAVVARASKLADLDEEHPEASKAAAAEAFAAGASAKDGVRLTLHGEGAAVRLKLGLDVPALKFFVLMGQAQQKANAGAAAPNP